MYSKHKDARPEDTIARIQGILKDLGMEPTVSVMQSGSGIYSAYMEDKRHGWHVNGKGTTQAYCLASAYGEAMERLQAYHYYERLEDDDAAQGDDFRISPDEQRFETARCKEAYPEIFSALRHAYALDQGMETEQVDEAALTGFLCRYFSDTTVTLPYYSVWEERVVHLPELMISALCGSNGLCAGNTPCEAINQGISEILERHVKELIFRRGYTPPEIPRTYIREHIPSLYEAIVSVEESGPYAIVVKDASLGMGMPVACALFVDREHQRYHAKFGSSFSLSVAIERGLTELFQGFDLKNPKYHEQFMTPWNAEQSARWNDPANRRMQLRTDMGSVPVSFISGAPSWTFRDWETTEGYGHAGMDNRAALAFMLGKLRVFHPQAYIRDYSFLGFPAYRIFVPGVSDTHMPIGPKQMHYRICKADVEKLYRVPAVRLSQEELSRCYAYLTSQDNVYRDSFGTAPLDAVQAVFHVVFGETQKAIKALRALEAKGASKRYACAAMELELAQMGIDAEQRDKTLALFFAPGDVAYACRTFRRDAQKHSDGRMIDRVIDPAGRKIFASKGGGSSRERVRLHAAMRAKLRENCPDQADLSHVFRL